MYVAASSYAIKSFKYYVAAQRMPDSVRRQNVVP
jgi:hypothetical protein